MQKEIIAYSAETAEWFYFFIFTNKVIIFASYNTIIKAVKGNLMKKALLIIAIILCSAQLFSAEPLVKFYLKDGSTKQYKFSEIQNLNFIKSKLSYVMQIHINDPKLTYNYDLRMIDQIQFEADIVRLSMVGGSLDIRLINIDSITFVWNTCKEIQIGSQVWMCKNLNVDHYRNGDPIPEVKDATEWADLTTGAWCYFKNDPAMGAIYCKLYNWYAVNDPRGLAPEGYHVPSDSEWTELTTYLGGDSIAGGKLKESGIENWENPNVGASNEMGFSALPGGFRFCDGSYYDSGSYGGWWSSTLSFAPYAWSRYLNYDKANVGRNINYKTDGVSVRCIKDN